jgi:hypothetical protein
MAHRHRVASKEGWGILPNILIKTVCLPPRKEALHGEGFVCTHRAGDISITVSISIDKKSKGMLTPLFIQIKFNREN